MALPEKAEDATGHRVMGEVMMMLLMMMMRMMRMTMMLMGEVE